MVKFSKRDWSILCTLLKCESRQCLKRAEIFSKQGETQKEKMERENAQIYEELAYKADVMYDFTSLDQ